MMWERQIHHGVSLALLVGLIALACRLSPDLLDGQWAGIPTSSWFVLSIAIPIAHQVYVWLVWRAELHYGFLTKWLGRETGFRIYSVGFGLLFCARMVALITLAISNYGTFGINLVLAYGLAVVLVIPWAYAFYSVIRYFGIRRALGIDHFDPNYSSIPFVKKGIFRFTSNGMYGPGFLVVWLPGLVCLSQAALLAALFGHLYIWVHYFVTELPDIRRIYGDGTSSR